jgi:hypothetical protein
MGFPKKIKKDINLGYQRTLYPRRVELLEKINEKGTFLPKSILHADLDRGFLDFVKEDLKLVVDGKKVPNVDILITTQNWAQFTQTWNFQDLDSNIAPPFITVVRTPEIKYGSLPSLQYTIPNRKQFYYASVPSFDGNRLNVDVYKIPQPIPVDIKFSIKVICNRMRELNEFNKTVLQKFSSRQAYVNIKGHYIPIIWDAVSDESVMDLEKRKYYLQSYDFTMMGFLMDEDEFEIKPAITRVLQLYETTDFTKKKKKNKDSENPSSYKVNVDFPNDIDTIEKRFFDKVDLEFLGGENFNSYDLYINGLYYGNNVFNIQVNSEDLLSFYVNKNIPNEPSKLEFLAKIV